MDTNCLECGLIQKLAPKCQFCKTSLLSVEENQLNFSKFYPDQSQWQNAIQLKDRIISLDQSERKSELYDQNKPTPVKKEEKKLKITFNKISSQ